MGFHMTMAYKVMWVVSPLPLVPVKVLPIVGPSGATRLPLFMAMVILEDKGVRRWGLPGAR